MLSTVLAVVVAALVLTAALAVIGSGRFADPAFRLVVWMLLLVLVAIGFTDPTTVLRVIGAVSIAALITSDVRELLARRHGEAQDDRV